MLREQVLRALDLQWGPLEMTRSSEKTEVQQGEQMTVVLRVMDRCLWATT